MIEREREREKERRTEKHERRVMKEGARETETKLFVEPFARSPARRRFIVSLFSSKYILFRETRSLAARGFRLSPTKTTARSHGNDLGNKVSRLILPYSIS